MLAIGTTRRSRVLLACALLLLGSCREQAAAPVVPGSQLPVDWLLVGNARISVEIAATRAARQRGLMFRRSLPADHGMLFLFPEAIVLDFWMKDTPIPLSIAFADASGRIVRIADMEPDSLADVSSVVPARYALEMTRGWFAQHGIAEGDAIRRIPQVQVE
jgi:uncharacterized protein